MKFFNLVFFIHFSSSICYGQKILSGTYDMGVKLAYDDRTNKLTGYYENATGWDDDTKSARFSCIFYLEGTANGDTVIIKTYYPANSTEDLIIGQLIITDSTDLSIKLPKEHGGCWNVQHFTDEPVNFKLDIKSEWKQIRFVTAGKSYFYSEKSMDKKQKACVVKNDFLCVERIEGEWAYCTFYAEKNVTGWIKISDLNRNEGDK